MAAAYIDADFIDAYIGADVRAALFTTPTAAYSGTHLGVVIAGASADIQAAARGAGYTVGDTTTDPILKKATLVVFLQTVNSRKGVEIGKSLIQMWGGYIDAIISGKAELEGQNPDTVRGVGGASFTDASDTPTSGVLNARPELRLDKLTGY